MTTYVDLETARAARGVRLVVVGGFPSPWSEAAKAILRFKGVDFVAVRLAPKDEAVRAWTQVRNAPVVMADDEPARTGWAEILEFAERLAPTPSLIPERSADRVRLFGLGHELLGEGGLCWSSRLAMIGAGLATDGARGFHPRLAGFLSKRYGFSPQALAEASLRVPLLLRLLEESLGDGPWFFGQRFTALDLYSATSINLFDPPPHEVCPMLEPLRRAFESMRGAFGPVPPALLAHRARVYAAHMELPIAL